MPLIQSGSKKAVGMNIRREQGHGKPHAQSVAIALSVARKNGMRLPPPPNSVNIGKKVRLGKISGAAELDSPFYRTRPECQDGPTTMNYLEAQTKSKPTSVNMELSHFEESMPPRSEQPFSDGTASQLSDKPPFMKGA